MRKMFSQKQIETMIKNAPIEVSKLKANSSDFGKVLGVNLFGSIIPVEVLKPVNQENVIIIDFTEDDWDPENGYYSKDIGEFDNGVYRITFDGTPAHNDAEFVIVASNLYGVVDASFPKDWCTGFDGLGQSSRDIYFSSAMINADISFINGIVFYVNVVI